MFVLIKYNQDSNSKQDQMVYQFDLKVNIEGPGTWTFLREKKKIEHAHPIKWGRDREI